jgi:hypothetical protein
VAPGYGDFSMKFLDPCFRRGDVFTFPGFETSFLRKQEFSLLIFHPPGPGADGAIKVGSGCFLKKKRKAIASLF